MLYRNAIIVLLLSYVDISLSDSQDFVGELRGWCTVNGTGLSESKRQQTASYAKVPNGFADSLEDPALSVLNTVSHSTKAPTTLSANTPIADPQLRSLGVYHSYPTLSLINDTTPTNFWYGLEDSAIEIALPQTCLHVGWFFSAESLHGSLSSGAGIVASATEVPAASRCQLLFTPDREFSGEQHFWYTVKSVLDDSLFLRHGVIAIAASRDPPAAVDDAVASAQSDSWLYIPVLTNDHDADVGMSPVCMQPRSSDGLTVRVVIPDRQPTMPSSASRQDVTLALVTVAGAGQPVPCLAELPSPAAATWARPVPQILTCTVSLPDLQAAGPIIPPLSVTVLPAFDPASVALSVSEQPYTYSLQNIPVFATIVIRHTSEARPPHLAAGYKVLQANNSLPTCKELRIISVSDPLHGQAVAVPVPMFYEMPVSSPTLTGPVSHTLGYSAAGRSLPLLIAYHPDPGFTGTDTFSYDIGDGHAGNGQQVTGQVTVNVVDGAVAGSADSAASSSPCVTWKCSIQTNDGRYNTISNPDNGAMMTPLKRLSPPAYGDGIDSPAGSSRPSTRVISNELFHQADDVLNTVGLSELSVHFGQFLTHDIDFSTPLADYKADANFVIPIPEGDAWFTGQSTMRFRRSGPQLGTGAGTGVPRQQLNKITSWLDLNVIYGTMTSRNRALRTTLGGKLLHMVGTDQTHNNTAGVATVSTVASGKLSDSSCFNADGLAGSPASTPFCRPVRGDVEHLSLNYLHLPNLNLLGKPRDSLFVSGDNRVNVQPGLVAMHTLLGREHNAVVDELQAALLAWKAAHDGTPVTPNASHPVWRALNPHAPSYHTPPVPTLTSPVLMHVPSVTGQLPSSAGVPYPVPLAWPHPFDGSPAALKAYDEPIFQTARAITRAKWQAVVWYEWLPLMLGAATFASIPAYSGYKADTEGAAANEFATAAFRFGHSQIGSTMRRIDSTTGCPIEAGAISLRDAYFTASRILAEGGIDPVLAGSIVALAQDVDAAAVNEIRNLLFATHTQGFDLIAFNIQRGRDHGLPDYNTVRAAMGLQRVTSFDEITADADVAATLASLYASVDDIDLVVGGLAEDHVPGGAVGSLFAAMIVDQFVRIRDGDRFWFENDEGPQYELLKQVASIEQLRATRIADFLARSTDVLDGRLGAELVWARATRDVDGAVSGWDRRYRSALSAELSDSLFLARPSVLGQLNGVCEGAYSDSLGDSEADGAEAAAWSDRSDSVVDSDISAAMAEMGVRADGAADYAD